MPDNIEIGHVVTPTADSELGAKGAGEAGTAGAPGAVMNAINDALRPLGAKTLTDMPFTPADLARARTGLGAPGVDHRHAEIVEMPNVAGGERGPLCQRNFRDHAVAKLARLSGAMPGCHDQRCL